MNRSELSDILGPMSRSEDAHDPDDGRPHRWPAPARESLVDRQIREAQESGAFDDLPYRGQRIPLEDDSAAGDWALAHHILKNAHMVPPWIATDREVRDLLTRRDAILARAPRSSAIGRGATGRSCGALSRTQIGPSRSSTASRIATHGCAACGHPARSICMWTPPTSAGW